MKSKPLLTAYHPSGNSAVSFFTLHCVESETSRLQFEPGVGTVFDKSLPREFEFQIYECDHTGYCGHAASFPFERMEDALKQLLCLADFDPLTIRNHATTQTA